MTESRPFRVLIETPDGPRSFDCPKEERIWGAAAENGLALPAICHQGRCLTCAGLLLEGAVEHDHPDTYFPEDEAAHYILICCAMPRSDVRIRSHQESEMRKHRIAAGLPAPYG